MENVVSLAAWKDAKRAAAIAAEHEAAKRQKVVGEKIEVAKALLDEGVCKSVAQAAVVASAMVEKANAIMERDWRPMPAYCDPANESRGAKYDATKSLDVAEIAKRMRAEIKALNLRAGFKISVTIQRFSGGRSIDIRVREVPADFRYWSDAAASYEKQFGAGCGGGLWRFPGGPKDQHSAEYIDVESKLEAIHGAYNRDNSDSMSDYFDVRYYGSVGFDGAWQALKDEAAASAGDYWSESADPKR